MRKEASGDPGRQPGRHWAFQVQEVELEIWSAAQVEVPTEELGKHRRFESFWTAASMKVFCCALSRLFFACGVLQGPLHRWDWVLLQGVGTAGMREVSLLPGQSVTGVLLPQHRACGAQRAPGLDRDYLPGPALFLIGPGP